MAPVDAETEPEAAGDVEVSETVPPITAFAALVIERLGVALFTVTFTLVVAVL